jgi:hypothetical protein
VEGYNIYNKILSMETLKKCISCKEDKHLNEFAYSKGKPREKCKACLKEYMNSHYKSNKDSYKDYVKKRKKELKNWYNEYKSNLKCEKCGENHPAVLDFHHINSNEKDFSIGTAMGVGNSIETILKEISKCMILCSNCHRKLHYEEKNKLL